MQASGPGAVSGAPTGTCAERCDYIAPARGASVTLTAQPNAGAQFAGWSGACTGTGSCTVTLQGNRAVTARFVMPVIFASTEMRPRALVGSAYSDTLVASGGDGSFAWAISSGALPQGLTLATATGVVTGTPTSEGRFDFTATATSGSLTASRSFTIVAVRPLAIVSDTMLPRAVIGTPYTRTLASEGGVGSVKWSVSGGTLPAGLALDETTGTLAGTPSTAGIQEFTVLATSDTLRASRKFRLSIVAAFAITSEPARRGAVMGAPYADTVRATGGTGAFTWRVSEGALPTGLALDAGGVITGTPTVSGTFKFTATVGSEDLTAVRAFEIAVAKPSIAAGVVLDELLGERTTLTTDQRNFLDLLGNRNGRVDVGDVRAWLIDTQALPASAPQADVMSVLGRLRDEQSSARNPTAARAPAPVDPRDARP